MQGAMVGDMRQWRRSVGASAGVMAIGRQNTKIEEAELTRAKGVAAQRKWLEQDKQMRRAECVSLLLYPS